MSTRTKFLHIKFHLLPLHNDSGSTKITLNNCFQFGFFWTPSKINSVKALQQIESSFPFQFLNKFDLDHEQWGGFCLQEQPTSQIWPGICGPCSAKVPIRRLSSVKGWDGLLRGVRVHTRQPQSHGLPGLHRAAQWSLPGMAAPTAAWKGLIPSHYRMHSTMSNIQAGLPYHLLASHDRVLSSGEHNKQLHKPCQIKGWAHLSLKKLPNTIMGF